MKFYNRESEIQRLPDIERISNEKSQMTIILGRRRIGKTRLILETFKHKPFLYFFVARTSDHLLAQEFLEEIKVKLDIPIYSDVKSSKEILRIILKYAERNPLTLVIDEFQNYQYVNSAIFSELQNLWDQHKEFTKLNLILMGSVSTLMNHLFKNSKEPLFGRADHQITVNPFTLDTMATVLSDYEIYSDDSLCDYMIFSGGVPKYVELISNMKKKTFFDFLDSLLTKDSLVIAEGKTALVEEFGRNYSIYFAILQLIASGKTKRSELLSSLPEVKELGGYLNNLIETYGLIKKVAPVLSPGNSKNLKYQLDDYFYSFWFRFIYRNQSALEADNFNYVKRQIVDEWPIHRGQQFEKILRNHLKTLSRFDIIGSYWDRKGENEIDIVAIDSLNKVLLLGECKCNEKKIDLFQLKRKSESFIGDFHDYRVIYRGFYPGMLTTLLTDPQTYLFGEDSLLKG